MEIPTARAENVRQWRLDELERMGFTTRRASTLADVPDVAHRAAALMAGGCSVDLAYRILRPDPVPAAAA